MKRFLFCLMFASFLLPAVAADYTVPAVESVKSFAKPSDARLQYGLPEGKSLNVFRHSGQSNTVSSNDSDDIVLDTSDLKPTKKVIKKISPDYQPDDSGANASDMPMNYDSFPKFYNQNDLMNQQFMPMMGY